MIQSSIGHKSHVHSSLAGKRKLSPPKNTIVKDTPQLRQGTSGLGRPTQMSDSPIDAETTQDLIHISSVDAHTPQIRPKASVNTDQRMIIEATDSAEIEGWQKNPVLLDIAPEGVAHRLPNQDTPDHTGNLDLLDSSEIGHLLM